MVLNPGTPFADISNYQSSVDLATYRRSHRLIALKATEGLDYYDPTFASRWRQAGNLGLVRIAYHFGIAGQSGAAQFDVLLDTVRRAGGLGSADVLCLDSEDTSAPGRAAAHAREFTTHAEALGYPGVLYTGAWYANPNQLTPQVLAPSWRSLWLSDYSSARDSDIVLPNGWARSQAWARQWTSSATIPGIAGPADYNRLLVAIHDEEDPLTPAERAELVADIENRLAVHFGPTSVNNPNSWVNSGFGRRIRLDTQTTVNNAVATIVAAIRQLPGGHVLNQQQLEEAVRQALPQPTEPGE